MPHESNDITANNFYLAVQCNQIDTNEFSTLMKQNKTITTGREVPQGDSIMTFKGIASQNYAVGEKSRNAYKYDQKGWDFSEYTNNPIILWQHDSKYGGIGHATSFFLDTDGNLNILFYVDLATLEPRNAVQVQKGFVAGISTGASTVEFMFEDNTTGERLSRDDAEEKFGWENVWLAMCGYGSEFITLVITKAKMIENSLVTIGSNDKAMAVANSIGNSFKNTAEEYKNSKKVPTLITNSLNPMEKEVQTNNETGEETPEVTAPTVTDEVTDPVDVADVPAELENAIANAKKFSDDVESLKNQIVGMKATHENEINALKAENAVELEKALNKMRADERANLGKVVATKDDKISDVKTTDQIINKYGNK